MLESLLTQLVQQNKTRWFGVTFVKRDGYPRKMTASVRGIKTVGGRSFLTVYSVGDRGFRSFYVDSVLALNVRKYRLSTSSEATK